MFEVTQCHPTQVANALICLPSMYSVESGMLDRGSQSNTSAGDSVKSESEEAKNAREQRGELMASERLTVFCTVTHSTQQPKDRQHIVKCRICAATRCAGQSR